MRLHRGLIRQGVDSWLHHRFGSSTFSQIQADQRRRSWPWRIAERYVIGRRWRQQKTERGLFIHGRWIYPSRLRQFGPLPGIVNLHLVFRWLDLRSFLSSIPHGMPVVWSLHDLHAATGGCIHPLGCDHFATHCHDCPSLKRPGRHDQSWLEFRLKERLYSRLNLHIVGNSEWTTAQARCSALMRHARSFHTIPLGLDTGVFRPVEKNCARQALGIARGHFAVGFGCADFSDPNKGGALLTEALHTLAGEDEITLVAFGGGRLPADSGRYEIMELGSIQSPQLQSLIYSACDVFAAPSRIESFGLTALEAMACGTPVVAFRTGGLKDVVADGETGLLGDEIGTAQGVARMLSWMWKHPTERAAMGIAARQRAVNSFSDSLMAQRYADLYRELISAQRSLGVNLE
jgi:glycosyltransferase involved in cell wall biosynthesis